MLCKIKELPYVSVLCPTQNRRNFLTLLFKWYKQQDYKGKKELVILDDSDNTNDDIIPDRKDIKYCYLSNKISIGAKRNFLNQMAEGDIMVCMDDDDYYAPNYISEHVNALTSSNNIVMSGVRYNNIYDLNQGISFCIDNGRCNCTNANLGYKRSILDYSSYKPETKLMEEVDFICNISNDNTKEISPNSYLHIIHKTNTAKKDGLSKVPQSHLIENKFEDIVFYYLGI